MARERLHGATRRDFIRGAFALGAALGWGPTRIFEFLDRGGGLAHGIGEKAQNLLVICGFAGAGGYWHNLFPHPDALVGQNATATQGERYAPRMPLHFLQDAAGGGVATNMGGAFLGRFHDYSGNGGRLAAMPDAGGGLGAWAPGERFKRLRGAANMGFRGFQSQNDTSRAIDRRIYGSDRIPSNRSVSPNDNFVVYARESPFQKYGLKKGITQIEGGPIQIHANGAQNHRIRTNGNWTIMAAAATCQQEVRPAVLQALLVGQYSGTGYANAREFYGNLPGAPEPAVVNNAAGMVSLFASNAVKAGGALINPRNAVLYEAFYKGMLGTQKSATLPTYFRSYQTTKLGSHLVGVNLADKLTPTAADQRRYGLTGNSPAKFAEFRNRLIIAEKAFKLGLSTMICIGMEPDDIHSLYTSSGQGGINAAQASAILGTFLDAFMEGLTVDEEGKRVPDPFHPELTLGDNTVILFVQDNLRSTFDNPGWPDDSLLNQNRAWILSNGFLQVGAFGGERPLSAGGSSEGGYFDPVTGDLLTATQAANAFAGGNTARVREIYGEMAMAATLYAVTRGNTRRVADFYTGPDYPVLRVPQLL
ncbi:MAG: hypothetical protein RMK29_11650 [Myxococcales bacterium]|nr:hypothetical protein [Myxococcota bacterium]MDW8282362.1 hypothetical protein [Myxococcales bacterium]